MSENSGFDDFDFESIDWSQMEHNVSGEGREDLPEGVESVHIISPEMLAKRLLWDISPCSLAVDAGKVLGLPPASPDVEDMEHTESHQRLTGAALAAPFIQEMARHASNAVVAAIITASGAEAPQEDRDESAQRLEPVIFQSAFAIIAEMIDMGILHLPHFGTFVFHEESGDGSE